jgi:2-C-methyl-D-erythritol 2,4-cyclodiphosphate synthase
LVNVDSIVCLQRPKIAGHVPAMRQSIAGVMGVDFSQVSVKATTTEKLGFVGREEGVSAHAVVMLRRRD